MAVSLEPDVSSTACLTCGATLAIPEDLAAEAMSCSYCGASQPVPDVAGRRDARAKVQAASIKADAHRRAAEIEAETERRRIELEHKMEQERHHVEVSERKTARRWGMVHWHVSTAITLGIIGFSLAASFGGMWFTNKQVQQATSAATSSPSAAPAAAPSAAPAATPSSSPPKSTPADGKSSKKKH